MPNLQRAERRERKRKSKEKDARMRGGRSVFEIGKAIAKRAKSDKRKRKATR